MKNKKWKALIIIALLTWALMISAFTFEKQIPIMEEGNFDQITPFWVNTDDISLKLSFSGGKANCTVNVLGKAGTTKIVADVKLVRINSDGRTSTVATWNNLTSNSDTLRVGKTATVTSGYTYRLEADVEVYKGSVGEYISLSKEGYY